MVSCEFVVLTTVHRRSDGKESTFCSKKLSFQTSSNVVFSYSIYVQEVVACEKF